jgi:hypothetical protein
MIPHCTTFNCGITCQRRIQTSSILWRVALHMVFSIYWSLKLAVKRSSSAKKRKSPYRVFHVSLPESVSWLLKANIRKCTWDTPAACYHCQRVTICCKRPSKCCNSPGSRNMVTRPRTSFLEEEEKIVKKLFVDHCKSHPEERHNTIRIGHRVAAFC